MNDKKEIINQILYLPETFKKPGNNKSLKKLFEETEYFKIAEQVHEKDFCEAIKENPQFIKTWINWSDDKRSASGWFIKEDKTGKYMVSFFPKTEGLETLETHDAKIACAYFIKMEIESLMNQR